MGGFGSTRWAWISTKHTVEAVALSLDFGEEWQMSSSRLRLSGCRAASAVRGLISLAPGPSSMGSPAVAALPSFYGVGTYFLRRHCSSPLGPANC